MAIDIASSLPRGVKDIRGERFGKLTAVSFSHIKGNAYWNCVCDCGKPNLVSSANLRSGSSSSCGCWNGDSKRTHGLSKHPIFRIHSGMIQRCENPDRDSYPWYGGRGIKVCERWRTFSNFANDMLDSWRPGLQIERIDSDGNYCPENCRWATKLEQANNTRTNQFLTMGDKTLTYAQWGRETGIPASVIWKRVNRRRWETERALTTPLLNRSTSRQDTSVLLSS